jgi:hypothetical protein
MEFLSSFFYISTFQMSGLTWPVWGVTDAGAHVPLSHRLAEAVTETRGHTTGIVYA